MKWFNRRKKMRSEKLARRRRKELSFKLGLIAIIVVILIGFSSWFLHRPNLQIVNIVVNGNSVVLDEDITDVTKEVLNGKYFYLFPRMSSLIFPEEEIETSILNTFKQIESVDIIRTDLGTLSMEIVEQNPHALWCVEKDEDTQDSCYFLNKEGLIFSKAPNFTGNVFFRFYGELEDINPIGRYYLKTNNEFSRVNVLIDSVSRLAIVPIELRPLLLTDMELYIEGGSKILFNREQPTSVVLENLKIVLESETFQDEDMENIEYIDLRFGNKVYFKLKSN